MHDERRVKFCAIALVMIASALSCGGGNHLGGGTGGGAGSSGGGRGADAGTFAGGNGGGTNVGGDGGSASCAMNLGGWIGSSSGGTNGGSNAGTNNGGGNGGNAAAGSGGRGGSGSSLPVCTNVGRYAGGALHNPDDTSILAPLTATVTMAAVEDWPGNSAGIRVTLADTASTRRWVWWLAIPDMPADQINGCDRYELEVDASPCPFPGGSCQTVVLARGGALVAFTVDLQAGLIPLPAALAPWGITVADAGAFCEISSPTCGEVHHTARVTVGNETATLTPYQTVTLHGLSISVGSFETIIHTICDVPATTRMAGFRLP
jgi:hypothetical protein